MPLDISRKYFVIEPSKVFPSNQSRNQSGDKIVTFAREGDACNRNDNEWYAIPESDSHFLYCHPKHGLYVKGQCGLANDGRRMIFDVAAQQCIAPLNSTSTAEWLQKKSNTWPEFHLISRKNLGDQCTSNAECPNSSFCDHFGTCVCLPDFVLVQASCWKKAEPTEACTHNEQCEAAWPHSVCINGICNCPNNTRMVKSFVGRLCLSPAYICIQPASSQNGIFDFNQYFYNSLTDECEPIMFKGGGMANSNIFKTRRECENFCKSGEPETKLGRPVKCRSNADCSSPYDCYHRSGDQTYGICCPSKAFVCSPFGGVFMDIALLDEPLIEYDEGLQARSTQSLNFPVIRYYFSIQELKCKAFLYRGIGGNFNNFLSFEQCFDHCMPVVCGGGKTALDRAGRLIRCVNDRDCPAHHSCHAGICCQRKVLCPMNSSSLVVSAKKKPLQCNLDSMFACPTNFTCSFPDKSATSGLCCFIPNSGLMCPGDLKPPVEKSNVKSCSPLKDSSCDQSNEICYFNQIYGNYYCCPNVFSGKSCTGGKVSKKFYFDPVERICKAFNYFGCNGNDNRFNTIGECESWCDLSAVCSHGLPIRESRETRNCSAEKSCPSGYKCVSVTNGENFCCPDRSKLKENIQFHFNYCDTVKDLVCNMPLNPGFSCSSVEQSEMFFYHFSSKACLKFKYEGCGGNLNRFHTLQSCQSFCLSMLCPVGNPLSTNGEVKHCKTDHECPSDFDFDMTLRAIVASSLPLQDVLEMKTIFITNRLANTELLCPAGSTAFINSATSQPLQCAENAEICPPGFKCYNNIQNGKSICCSALTKCLSGLEPYKVKENIRPLKCIPGRFGFFDGCPNKYECQETTNGEFHCCPEANVTNACPEQVKVHVHKERSQPTKCYAADPSCPNGYVCRLNHMFGHRFCCAEPKRDSSMLTAEVSLCPDRSKPYIDPTTKLTAVCNPYLHFTCPTSYSCTFIQSASNYHCCISNQLQPYTAEEQSRETPACPGGLQPFINRANGQPVICQPPLLGICPAGSICQYSSLYWQFICCASDIYSKNFHDEIKVILPGDTGCQNDRQCSNGFPGSFCHQGICKCPPSMFIYQRSCVPSCPNGYNTNNGVCENAK
ncbi:Uncharacterized protein T4B_11582 [Trichinella pseudospiralis]|uniref:BPTI/Kunitz inhibitor domain-containing protein n=1 Tax=Trichinella pseudospiralis TaxID=6337 RepID=A0A0V1IM05_TRIPS|nr:Uncharacterized protein T4B_11582 [Trichinella pseudospiralis]